MNIYLIYIKYISFILIIIFIGFFIYRWINPSIYKKSNLNLSLNLNSAASFDKDWESFIFSDIQNVIDYYGNTKVKIFIESVRDSNSYIVIENCTVLEATGEYDYYYYYKINGTKSKLSKACSKTNLGNYNTRLIYNIQNSNITLPEFNNSTISLINKGQNLWNFNINQSDQSGRTYNNDSTISNSKILLDFDPKKNPQNTDINIINNLYQKFLDSYPQYIIECCRITNDITPGSIFNQICINKQYINNDNTKSVKCDDTVSKYCSHTENQSDPLCGCYTVDNNDPGWQVFNYFNSDPGTKSIAKKSCLIAKCNNKDAYKSLDNNERNINCASFCGVIQNAIAGDNTVIIEDVHYKLNCSGSKIPPFDIVDCTINNDCKDGKICDNTYKCINCTESKQCGDNKICESGICKDNPTPNACNSNTDCNDGYICDTTSKTCKVNPTPNACNSNTDCNDGYICDTTSKTCKVNPTPNDCNSDNDCKDGYICDMSSKTCKVNPNTTPNACNSNTDCKDNGKCINKKCITNKQYIYIIIISCIILFLIIIISIFFYIYYNK
jgi:hypothetical protein